MPTHFMRTCVRRCARISAALAVSAALMTSANAAPAPQQPSRPPPAPSNFVPGAGTCIDYAGDDFEDTTWSFTHRMPKSSREQDEQVRGPMGTSVNDRWHEGPERGQPD